MNWPCYPRTYAFPTFLLCVDLCDVRMEDVYIRWFQMSIYDVRIWAAEVMKW